MNLTDKLCSIGFERVAHGNSYSHRGKSLILYRSECRWKLFRREELLYQNNSLANVYIWMLRNGGSIEKRGNTNNG